MTWWHADIDVWAGTDGTDIYKAYVDIINAVHERCVATGRYYDNDGPFSQPRGHRLLTLEYNTNGEATQPPVYGTKAAPLSYEDVLGIPLNGKFYYMALNAIQAVGDLHFNPFNYQHPSAAGWAKTADWDGEDPTGVWTTDEIEAEFGPMFGDVPINLGTQPNVFYLPILFKYMRRVLEVLVYPILYFTTGAGMAWPEDWVFETARSACTYTPPVLPPVRDIPIGTIIEVGIQGNLQQDGFGWRGSFIGYGPISCPWHATLDVTPAEALGSTRSHEAYFNYGPEDPEAPRRGSPHPPPLNLFKRVSGPSVGPHEFRMIAIPPEFRGPPLYLDRGFIVHSIYKRCTADGRQETKVKVTPVGVYGNGTVLKEFMYFAVSATNCPIVSWVIGNHTITIPAPAEDGGPGAPFTFYEVSGVLDPVAEKTVPMRWAESISENPFNGVYDEWHTYNSNDTVYILRERVVVHGLGRKGVYGMYGQSAFAIMDMAFTYV